MLIDLADPSSGGLRARDLDVSHQERTAHAICLRGEPCSVYRLRQSRRSWEARMESENSNPCVKSGDSRPTTTVLRWAAIGRRNQPPCPVSRWAGTPNPSTAIVVAFIPHDFDSRTKHRAHQSWSLLGPKCWKKRTAEIFAQTCRPKPASKIWISDGPDDHLRGSCRELFQRRARRRHLRAVNGQLEEAKPL